MSNRTSSGHFIWKLDTGFENHNRADHRRLRQPRQVQLVGDGNNLRRTIASMTTRRYGPAHQGAPINGVPNSPEK
jgi:hypothetical protein